MRIIRKSAVCPAMVVLALLFPIAIHGQDSTKKVDPRIYLGELSRLGALKPFLTDSPDVYLEPQSLNKFFTEAIYRKLQGNPYFGYRYDEGFVFEGEAIQVETIKDLTPGTVCAGAYRLALEKALTAAGLQINPEAACQVGLCIVGIEERETTKTIPGVMVEAYLRNVQLKKSFFIRYGAGSPRGLPAALRLSAEMLISELQHRRQAEGNK